MTYPHRSLPDVLFLRAQHFFHHLCARRPLREQHLQNYLSILPVSQRRQKQIVDVRLPAPHHEVHPDLVLNPSNRRHYIVFLPVASPPLHSLPDIPIPPPSSQAVVYGMRLCLKAMMT